MPKYITLEPHLSLEELHTRYRQASDPVERSHYQIIWLLASGKSPREVAAVTGYSRSWVYELVWGYNRLGPESLGDGRRKNRGAEPLLNDVQQALLWQALSESPPDGGLGNGGKVADWMSELLDRPVSPQRGWEYLRQMKFRLRVPPPHHERGDAAEQEAGKKKLGQEAQKLQNQYPDPDVQVWCEDEHRLGLKPVRRRVWVEEGFQPIAQVHWRFEWLWLVGFVHPPSGETYWWIVPAINTLIFNLVLADFAEHMGVGEKKRILLAVDQAGWHLSKELEIPEGIHLELMPSHSPELQPAERLWPLANEPIANKTFPNLDELEEVLFQRCRLLLNQRDLVRGLTNFHWWPQGAA